MLHVCVRLSGVLINGIDLLIVMAEAASSSANESHRKDLNKEEHNHLLPCTSNGLNSGKDEKKPWQVQEATANEEKPTVNSIDDPWITAIKQLDQDNLVRGKVGLVVNQRYKVVSKISFGSYGAIFVADDLLNPNEAQVAVKFEGRRDDEGDVHLNYESNVYQSVQGSTGVACVHWFGREFDHEIMVMDLLGPTLEQLFTFCNRNFTLQTVVGLGWQMLERIRHLHDRGFVHRDIKPENFLMGVGSSETVCYLIDFGLARRYRFRQGKQLCHIPFRRGKNLVGTARYASLNSHNGFELSRRDDLESLAYILIEFIIGDLPWKENRSKGRYRAKKQVYNRIKYSKENMDWEQLCPSLAAWVRYCRQLPFDAPPDYHYLHDQLQNIHNPFRVNEIATKLDWLGAIERSDERRYAYECLFRWTLPRGHDPRPPQNPHSFGFSLGFRP